MVVVLRDDVAPKPEHRGLVAAALFSFAALVIGVVGLAFHNLGNRYIWTDESSSLFTSLGWPGVGERSGSLAGAWDWTMATHVEPGLYNMLERFWALGVGSDITTLRLYPFLFFLIYLSSVVGIGRLLQLPWFVIAGVLGLLLLENITPYYTVELRPSSAGLAASVALPFLALVLLHRTKLWSLFAFFAGITILGSMQYNSYPIAFATGIVLIFFGFLRLERREGRLLQGAGMFALVWLPLVYVTTRGNPLGVAQDSQLHAIPEALIPNMDATSLLNLMQQNLLSPTALPRTIFLIVLPLMWATRTWSPPSRKPAALQQMVNQIWVIVLTATLATAGIGFLGVMPWILGTRWSIAEVGLIGLSLLGLSAVVVQRGFLRSKPVLVGAVLVSIAASLLAGYRLFTYERFPGYDWNAVLPIIFQGTPGKTVVDTEIYPDLRYWIELSGDYDAYRSDWISHQAQTTSDFDAADAASVQQFLDSANDRLLLGDATLLETGGIDIPYEVRVIPVPTWNDVSDPRYPVPVLLVRDR